MLNEEEKVEMVEDVKVEESETVVKEDVSKGKGRAQKVIDETKEAGAHTWKAVKILISNPSGGQGEALKELGEANALKVGVFLTAIFLLVVLLFGIKIISNMFFIEKDFGVYLKLFLFAAIPVVSIFGCYYGIMKIFAKENDSIAVALYTTGITLIPIVFIMLFGILLKTEAFGIFGVVLTFGMTSMVLLINSSLQDVYKLSAQKAFLLTPALIMISGYGARVMFGGMF